MTKTIKILLAAFLFLACFNFAEAQRGRFNQDPEKMAARQTDNMAEALALSDAQKEKIGAVNLEYAKKMQEARKNADGDFSNIRETMRAMRSEQKEAVKKYLTSEQFEKFEKLEAERRKKRGQFRKQRGGEKDKKLEDKKTIEKS